MENTISIEIPADVQNAVISKFNEIAALLDPFTVNVADDEQGSLLKVGDKTIPFVDKVKGYTGSAPEYVPGFMDVPEFLRDKAALESLDSMSKSAMPVVRMIDDLFSLTANDSFAAALIYYKSVKAAADAGEAKAKAIYEDLAKRFPGRVKASAITKVPQPK